MHSRSLIRIFTGRILGCQVSSCRQRRLWSECTDMQADLRLRWAPLLKCKVFWVVAHLSALLWLAVVPVLVLLFVALWFILRGDLFYVLTLCYFVLVFFSPFSIAITSPGEERANHSAFSTFVRFVLIWFYRFPLPLGVWKGLRFVIVALPGLFSYLFV